MQNRRTLTCWLSCSLIMSACTNEPFSPRESDLGSRRGTDLRVRYRATDHRILLEMPDAEDHLVYLGARRGRFGDLDCSSAPHLPWMRQAEIDENGDLVGPIVAASLREPFYDSRWLEGDISETMLEEASAGTDPIIDLCILDPASMAVVAAEERSLTVIMDESEEGDTSIHLKYALSTPLNGGINSSLHYAQRCVAELGDIPFFTRNGEGDYGSFDCTSAVEVPVTVTDSRGNATRARSTPARCDRPQYLGSSSAASPYGCEVGARVANTTNSRGTEWVLLCRKVQNATEGRFEDIAMIGHNPASGETCFFQNAIGQKTNGTAISHPGDTNDWSATWDSYPAGASCIGCHDTDPFIHTPWIDQALNSDGSTVVPEVASVDSPYSVVNMIDQGIQARRQLVSEGADACTGCHRVGEWRGRAWPSLLEQTDQHHISELITDWFRQPPHRYWMPLGSSFRTAADWTASPYGMATAFIQHCILYPDGCHYEPVPTGPSRIQFVNGSDTCGLVMAPSPRVETHDLAAPAPLLGPFITQEVSLRTRPTHPAEFRCGAEGRELELVPSGNGRAVWIRSELNGDYCYLTAATITSPALAWDCGNGVRGEFEVQYVDATRMQLRKRGPAGGLCGVARNPLTGLAELSCGGPGELLYLAEDVRERWRTETAGPGEERRYGPFALLPNSRLVAAIAPAAGSNGGDLDLYVRLGAEPTRGEYDCRPYTNGSMERCELTAPTTGTQAYVLVRGYSGTTQYGLEVNYVEAD